MRKFIFLLVFLVLIPISIASVLFEDWVESGGAFEAGDHHFDVQYIESSTKLNFKMDGMGGLMILGECETRENIKYCFEEVEGSKVKVKVESLEPDISIERVFSATKPGLNDEITVTVTLKNSGDKRAANVKYTDIYPTGLKVFYDGNIVEWEGNINAGEDEKFTYTIKAGGVISFDSIAKVSYQSGGKEQTKKSSAVAIDVQKPFSIDDAISKESVGKNEVVIYNLTITNKDKSSKLSVENLEVDLPPNIDFVSASAELKKEGNKLTFTGSLEKEGSKNFLVRVKSSRVGEFTIQTLAGLKMADTRFEEKLERTFNVGLSDIMPILNLTYKVKSNSPYDVYVAVKNYGKDNIKDVNLQVKSDLFDSIVEKKNIAAGATYEIFKKKLTAPYAEEDLKYNVMVSGSYVSSSGKNNTFQKSAQLIVTAPPKVVQIIKELNKGEFYPGDEIKVTVKIKNQRNKAVDTVDVSDIFPKEIRSSLSGNVTGYAEKLDANEEKKIYSYSLVIPKNYTENEIEFKTMLNARVDGELIILKRTDNVKVLHGEKPEGVEEQQKEEAKEMETQEEINKTEPETEKVEEINENFFNKIINWIKNLFKK